jgi:hypothetical protein
MGKVYSVAKNSDARELVGNVGLDRLCRGDAGGAASATVLLQLGDCLRSVDAPRAESRCKHW